ncbi:MAG: OprO/OprP family phosphate-selective porin [Candidatus Scalindua sp.]|nr:OprO/OprP family phosphate-selective porin [Candidatus Scalindua sp.]MCR4343478.1 OprO/OprP family phosphate-selective porin [Candidatus Scalindua sp.]
MRIFLTTCFMVIAILTMSLLFEPIKDVTAQERDDMQWQLKKMEEMMQKQMGMINNLKSKIEMQEDISKSYVTPIDDEVIGKKVDEYFEKGKGQGMWAKLMERPKLGYKKGFYFETADKNFMMKMTGRIQMRYGYTDRDNANNAGIQDDSSFRLRRSRLKWDGYAYKDFKYKIEMELGSASVHLLDYWASYNKNPALSVQFGQWKVPFNRQRVVSSANQQMIDRSLAQDEFTMDRQIGAMIHGKLFDKKFEYYAGIFNGNGKNVSANNNNEHLYIGRVSWNPFGAYGKGIGEMESDLAWSEKPKAHISAAIAYDGAADETMTLRTLGTVTAKEVNRTSLVAEYGLKYKGFSTNAEAYWRKYDNIGNNVAGAASNKIIDRGFFVQGGYFLIPKKLEVAGRYSYIDFDNNRNENALREETVGVNWFFNGHGHNQKVQFNFVREQKDLPVSTAPTDDTQYFYRIQYQMAF